MELIGWMQSWSLDVWRTLLQGLMVLSIFYVARNYSLSKKKAEDEAKKAEEDARHTQDKAICEQAITTIERAFLTLTGENGVSMPPEADRVNWLTAARQIIRFQQLKNQLSTELYQLVCSEHEEHWRHQFYLCLEHRSIQTSAAYFQGQDFRPSSENIDPTSALVVVNFSQWQPETDDPLDYVDKIKFIRDKYTLTKHYGLQSYLHKLNTEAEGHRKQSVAASTQAVDQPT